MALIALLLKTKILNKIHKIVLRRNTKDEFYTLYRQLLNDEEKFDQYFRLSSVQCQFYLTKKKIENTIKKCELNFLSSDSCCHSLAFVYFEQLGSHNIGCC